jgi:DNA-binding transcriptional regulator YiaG
MYKAPFERTSRLGPFQFNFPHHSLETEIISLASGGSGRVAESNSVRKLTSKPPISGAQIRAARALLNWSVRELSHQCRVSQSAISRSERVNGTPPMQVRNLDMLRRVLEEHGIEFLGLDGVRPLAQSPELARPAISSQAAHEG